MHAALLLALLASSPDADARAALALAGPPQAPEVRLPPIRRATVTGRLVTVAETPLIGVSLWVVRDGEAERTLYFTDQLTRWYLGGAEVPFPTWYSSILAQPRPVEPVRIILRPGTHALASEVRVREQTP